MKNFLFTVVPILFIGLNSFGQKDKNIKEVNFKEGMSINIPGERNESGKTLEPKGSLAGDKHERDIAHSNSKSNNPSTLPPMVPEKLSQESVASLQAIQNIIKSTALIQTLLKGDILLGLFSNNSIEQNVTSALNLNAKKWAELSEAFKNLEVIQNQQIQKIAEITQFEMSEKIDKANKEKKDSRNLRKEHEFWVKFEKNLPKHVYIIDENSFGVGESPITYASTGQVSIIDKISLSVVHGVVENGVKGMSIYPKITILNGHNKDIEVAAHFYHQNAMPLKDNNKMYYTSDGNVATSEILECCCKSSTAVPNFHLFMPYSELELSQNKKFKLKLRLSVFVYGEMLYRTNWYDFLY